MFNIFFQQHCFIQFLPNLAIFCLMQILVGGDFAVMKTNEMELL